MSAPPTNPKSRMCRTGVVIASPAGLRTASGHSTVRLIFFDHESGATETVADRAAQRDAGWQTGSHRAKPARCGRDRRAGRGRAGALRDAADPRVAAKQEAGRAG